MDMPCPPLDEFRHPIQMSLYLCTVDTPKGLQIGIFTQKKYNLVESSGCNCLIRFDPIWSHSDIVATEDVKTMPVSIQPGRSSSYWTQRHHSASCFLKKPSLSTYSRAQESIPDDPVSSCIAMLPFGFLTTTLRSAGRVAGRPWIVMSDWSNEALKVWKDLLPCEVLWLRMSCHVSQTNSQTNSPKNPSSIAPFQTTMVYCSWLTSLSFLCVSGVNQIPLTCPTWNWPQWHGCIMQPMHPCRSIGNR